MPAKNNTAATVEEIRTDIYLEYEGMHCHGTYRPGSVWLKYTPRDPILRNARTDITVEEIG